MADLSTVRGAGARSALSSDILAEVTLVGAETLTNKTLTTPVVASVYQDAGKTKLMTMPNTASDTLVTLAAVQTLTNKTVNGVATIENFVTNATDAAIAIAANAVVRLTKGSAAAMSIAATATDGVCLKIVSGSSYAHVITFTGNILDDGTATTKLKATMAAYVGASIMVVSANSRWVLLSNNACSLAAS
jgi:hypothetical protein